MQRGYESGERKVSDLPLPPAGPAPGARRVGNGRRCETCGGSMPNRTSRQRDDEGRLVCDSCKSNPQPAWTTSHSALSILDAAEMQRREAEAITSIVRVRKAKHAGLAVVAHDSGDNAILNHCPFCGSGSVVGGSDGTTTCEFCHSSFTVQVQPTHPSMPQTVNGQPVNMPGMPQGDESELSTPVDPTVEEEEDGVAADPLGDAESSPAPEGLDEPPPGRGGQPPEKPKGNQPPWLKNKKAYRTAEGHTLDAEAYMARLALAHADDREAVLDSVRMAHLQQEAVPPFLRAAEAADKGLTKHQIPASEIREGDFLDIGGKTRVAQRHDRGGRVLVRTQTRGARSPSIRQWGHDEQVTVWRRG